MSSFADLETKIGHHFQDQSLLQRALTHTSARNKQSKHGYERLEFLGDRVLGLVIADELLKRYPNEAEGKLAKRHIALVRGNALTEVAQAIGLGDLLILGGSEIATRGHEKASLLADCCEALIAALYRDGGFQTAERFILTHWADLFERYTAPPQDPKSALQEWAQGHGLPLPNYKLLKQDGPDHAPQFHVEIQVKGYSPLSASGPTKKTAEKAAAEKVLESIGKD